MLSDSATQTDRFKHLIRNRCGLCFEGRREAVLYESIGTRMKALPMEYLDEYYEYLAGNSQEFELLVNLLTINETYFFREMHHITLLVEQLIPELLKTKGKKIKILSAGCATGEEPYTIAMSLWERYGNRTGELFRFLACDIDGNALNTARAGIYGRHSFRRTPVPMREKYFKKLDENRFRLTTNITEEVTFAVVNLLDGKPVEMLYDLDVIFYRNVSIYFDREAQLKVLDRLTGALNEGGLLFLGSVETINHNEGLLDLIRTEGIFYYKKTSNRLPSPTLHPPSMPAPALQKLKSPAPVGRPLEGKEKTPGQPIIETPLPPLVPTPDSLYTSALSLAENKKYDDALAIVSTLVSLQPGHLGAFALKADLLFLKRQWTEAQEACGQVLKIDQWHLKSYLLLGLIARNEKNPQEAVRMFKAAVYIKTSCWIAHYYLADLYREACNIQDARREYALTVKLLEKDESLALDRAIFGLSFTKENILHLCRTSMDKLAEALFTDVREGAQ